jgi:hypothetical protein
MDDETKSENEYLRETAPGLFEHKIKVDDAPPAGYFDSLPAKMSARIASEFPRKRPPKGLIRHINFGNMAAAAAVALIIALVPVFRSLTDGQPTIDNLAGSFTSEEADIYITRYADDAELLELYYADYNDELFAELSFTDEVTDTDLENYLIREGVSTYEIAAVMDEENYDY